MPLFEVEGTEELVPFRQLHGGAALYEREIEELLWANLEDFTGESLFRIARQPSVPTGGKPDIVALEATGRVVVFEVKRDVDRGQLAQCLEYAGWARTTNLDELAALYHRGPQTFFRDWQAFTDSDVPEVVEASPRLVLVARDFHGRTESAFEFLIENGLPVKLVRVALYEDEEGRRFVDVEGEHEPEFVTPGRTEPIAWKVEGRRVRFSDLLDAGLLKPEQQLVWERPRLEERYEATVTTNGGIRLQDGSTCSSPSRAAVEAAGIPAYDGWHAWHVDGPQGPSLHDLRVALVEKSVEET